MARDWSKGAVLAPTTAVSNAGQNFDTVVCSVGTHCTPVYYNVLEWPGISFYRLESLLVAPL